MTAAKTLVVGKYATLQLLLGARNEFRGIGVILVQGVRLRDGKHPLVVRVDTPDGYLYTRFFLEKVRQAGRGALEVLFRITGYPGFRQEYMDEYEQPLVNVNLPREEAQDHLVLKLAPVALALGGRKWAGFSYAFQFKSAQRRIHRLAVDGSWELAGSVAGNTVLSQGQCNMPVYRGAKNTLFTTTCLKTLEQYGSPQGVSYQLAPRGGLIQAFDFQHGKSGALLQYWPCFDSISSVLESPKGSTRLHVLDEYRFALSRHAATTPQYVLFTPGPLLEHEARDLWWEAHEYVNGGIRSDYGVTPTAVVPEVGLRYSTRVSGGTLKMTVAGREVPSQEVPYAIGDAVLPRLAEKGIRRFFPEVMSESDVTVLGLKRKLDGGVHGDLHCASVCATHRFLPSEFWGGLKAWRYMAEKARALKIEIGCWFAPHFSPRAEILQQHPEYRMAGPNSLPWSGGYGIQTLVTADWNTGVYNWVLDDFRRWRDEGGLDYIFTDSWANLGLVEYNCAAKMRTNLKALGKLYAALQNLGIRSFTFEGISPFGGSRFGLADLRGDLLDAKGGVVGQNDFGWWVGSEDMAFGVCACVNTRNRTSDELASILFRFMANRGGAMFDDLYGMQYELPEWWTRLNFTFMQVLPYMKTRRLLPEDRGVLWSNGATGVLWAYKDFSLSLPKDAVVERLEGKVAVPLKHRGNLQAKAQSVYQSRAFNSGRAQP